MLRVTVLKTSGDVMWAVGRSLTWDKLDGWTLDSFRADSQGHAPGGTFHAPADWRAVLVAEVSDTDCELEEEEG